MVTTAIAAVTPPPAGTVAEDLTATIPAPATAATPSPTRDPAGRGRLSPRTRYEGREAA